MLIIDVIPFTNFFVWQCTYEALEGLGRILLEEEAKDE